MSTCANRTSEMSVDNRRLIRALKKKRNVEGLSLRKLSAQIDVSFSTLARIERGDGEPDNNSLLRILDWLGVDGEEAELKFDNVALVHFRASKNVTSATTRCLLEAASVLKKRFFSELERPPITRAGTSDSKARALSLSKPEMEEMSQKLRKKLGLDDYDAFDALALKIRGIEVTVPNGVDGLGDRCLRHLTGDGANDWSAMSVPLSSTEEKWVILRNDSHSSERQRVTYLEECWHILLGHKLTKVAKIGNAYGRTYESSEEHDAFYLAAASLLPEQAVRSAVEQGDSAEEIETRFGASPELIEYRIKRLGLWWTYKDIDIALS